MGGIRWVLAAVVLVVAMSGCQCCRLFDHYADTVDCIATQEHHFEVFYHPGLDLTRIGRPDWCQCGINRALCPCACARQKPLPHIMEPIPDYYRFKCDGVSPTPPQAPPADSGPPPTDGDASGSQAMPLSREMERSQEFDLPPDPPELELPPRPGNESP